MKSSCLEVFKKRLHKSLRYETDIADLALRHVIKISLRVFLDVASDILISECFASFSDSFSRLQYLNAAKHIYINQR